MPKSTTKIKFVEIDEKLTNKKKTVFIQMA